jgi:betaine reductase
MRDFSRVVSYPPNQTYIGNVSPKDLPEKPWHEVSEQEQGNEQRLGQFGNIVDETTLYGLIKYADVFDLVLLEESFSREVRERFAADDALRKLDTKTFDKAVSRQKIEETLDNGAVPIKRDGALVGCIQPAHPSDVNLNAHTMLENLTGKATALYAVLALCAKNNLDPASIDYIIETSEEACGDVNQRGGGNFAKAIGEGAGLVNATGSDTRAFCAAPAHGLLQGASLVQAGVFERVLVVAGGAVAKLAMNSKKHIEKNIPVLEDCLASFALLLEHRAEGGLLVRTDVVGRHKIGSGASPQVVIEDLVAGPLQEAGLTISSVGYYAPELQNSEITENAGAGNVTLSNLKMIAAMAVMKKEIERSAMNTFIEEHGIAGWAPTQGHIPSGVPAIGWFLRWAQEGSLQRAMVIGKGSLFLGRMTNLFDGVSILLENPQHPSERGTGSGAREVTTEKSVSEATTASVIGITIPGSEGGAHELYRGIEKAKQENGDLEVTTFGDGSSDPDEAHAAMETRLNEGSIDAALTFHYPFPLGIATVGLVNAPGTGKEMFIATTTGTSSTDRVTALVKNVVLGVSTARAYGIADPGVGFLNLEGAAKACNIVKDLNSNGWDVRIVGSRRGEPLLRGNDVLSGTADVLICDSLTGNTLMKMISAFSSGGDIEVTGSGYGPGLGTDIDRIVSIISRASSAEVVSRALLYTQRLVRGGLLAEYREQERKARAAGLEEWSGRSRSEQAPQSQGSGVEAQSDQVQPKVVNAGIEGIDVLEVDDAIAYLAGQGIYASAGMGCSGPIVMVADEDREQSVHLLREKKYIS